MVYNLFICCGKVSVEFYWKPVLSHLTKSLSDSLCRYLHFQQGIITSLPTPDLFLLCPPQQRPSLSTMKFIVTLTGLLGLAVASPFTEHDSSGGLMG